MEKVPSADKRRSRRPTRAGLPGPPSCLACVSGFGFRVSGFGFRGDGVWAGDRGLRVEVGRMGQEVEVLVLGVRRYVTYVTPRGMGQEVEVWG